MEFSTEEKQILEMVKKNPEKYFFVADNDLISLVKYNDDKSDGETVFRFEEYGQYFILQLLNYIGFNAEAA